MQGYIKRGSLDGVKKQKRGGKGKSEVDESLQRYFGVADWAIDTEEANKLWETTEKMLLSS